ncbi:hypothetical protein CFC21_027051 [Triticum aestivum]|uniref:Terpene synthase N-terminal domain-containing protein n=2 Tax=Triticum aestivum TaxID=4565 RepID=A0A9R1EML3_WHEAT|nr:hypothetical protein CFC21_027051 [Triticum aestivum]
MKTRRDKLKKDVLLLFKTCTNNLDRMTLVDVVQRLGIEHLFEEQTATALTDIHRSEFNSSNLHDVSLRFRLLREHGLWVSPGIHIHI